MEFELEPLHKKEGLFSIRYFYDFDVADNEFWGKTDCFNLKDSYQFFEKNGCRKLHSQIMKRCSCSVILTQPF